MLGKRNRRSHARLVPAVLACAVLAGASAASASADTTSTLGQATGRLAQLEQQIMAAQAELSHQQSALHRTLSSLSADQAAYEGVQATLMSLRGRLADAQAQYDEYRSAIDERAAQAYMQGPFAAAEALLTSGSVSELGDRLQFESVIAQHDGSLATQADASRAALQRAVDSQQRLLEQRSAVVRRTAAHQQQLALTFGAEQAALEEL